MQNNYAAIKAAGAELIAISSDGKAATRNTAQNHGIEFPLLADAEREVIDAYNVVDPGNNRIARPATYLITQEGKIGWKFLDVRLGGRVQPAKIIEELGKL